MRYRCYISLSLDFVTFAKIGRIRLV